MTGNRQRARLLLPCPVAIVMVGFTEPHFGNDVLIFFVHHLLKLNSSSHRNEPPNLLILVSFR